MTDDTRHVRTVLDQAMTRIQAHLRDMDDETVSSVVLRARDLVQEAVRKNLVEFACRFLMIETVREDLNCPSLIGYLLGNVMDAARYKGSSLDGQRSLADKIMTRLEKAMDDLTPTLEDDDGAPDTE